MLKEEDMTPQERIAEIKRLLNIDEAGKVRGLVPIWCIYLFGFVVWALLCLMIGWLLGLY